MPADMLILVINSGSSSLKASVLDNGVHLASKKVGRVTDHESTLKEVLPELGQRV